MLATKMEALVSALPYAEIVLSILLIVGIVLLALVVVGPQTWWGLLGIIPLLTGLVRY